MFNDRHVARLAKYSFPWLLCLSSLASGQSEWGWSNPQPHGDTLNDIVYGDGRFVAVGTRIQRSLDGIAWQSVIPDKPLQAIAYGNGRFVAVGRSGHAVISSDGLNWSDEASIGALGIEEVCFGDGMFVAVGQEGRIFRSLDGLEWSLQESPANGHLRSVTYGNGLFVAGGQDGLLLVSADATEWSLANAGTNMTILDLHHTGNLFVAAGTNNPYPQNVLTSPDAETWTAHSSRSSHWLGGIASAEGTLVAVGWTGIYASATGGEWAPRFDRNAFGASVSGFESVAFGAGRFVAVGAAGASAISEDGLEWTSQTETVSLGFPGDILFRNGAFLVGGGDPNEFLLSVDGVTWQASSGAGHWVQGLAYGDGVFVAVARSGKIQTSTDGLRWEATAAPTSRWLWEVAFGNGRFVAVGQDGIVATSQNGRDWSAPTYLRSVPDGGGIYAHIAFGAERFVAARSRDLFVSVDGLGWENVLSASSYFHGITFVNGQFFALGEHGLLLRSKDGREWEALETTVDVALTDIEFGNGEYVIVGHSGSILRSTDGLHWIQTTKVTGADLTGVAFGNGRFVATSGRGGLLLSPSADTGLSFSFDADLDGDGILESLDPNPGFHNPPYRHEEASYTLVVPASGRLANLVVPEADYHYMKFGYSSTIAPQLCRLVFQHLSDNFDFIFLVNDELDTPYGVYSGQHFPVRNDTLGLGLDQFDNTTAWGSEGRLQSVIHLTAWSGVTLGPSLHELAHRWANHLSSIPTANDGHWGFASAGGQLGGWAKETLEEVGSNLYFATNGTPGATTFGLVANGGNSLPYSALELYLMGLIPPGEVPPLMIARDAVFIDSTTFTSSGFDTATVEQIVSVDGERWPDHTLSQKNFSALVVVLSPVPISPAKMARYDKDIHLFGLAASDGKYTYNFWEATGGRAHINLSMAFQSLKSAVGTPLSIRLEIDEAQVAASLSIPSQEGKMHYVYESDNLLTWTPVDQGLVGDGEVVTLTVAFEDMARYYKALATPLP